MAALRQLRAQPAPQPSYAPLFQIAPCSGASITKSWEAVTRINEPLRKRLIFHRLALLILGNSIAPFHVSARRSCRQTPTRRNRHRSETTGQGSHFFAENPFKPSITRSCSATQLLELRVLELQASELANIGHFHAAVLIPPAKTTLLDDVVLAADLSDRVRPPLSRRMRMICSSEKRFFISKPYWSKNTMRTHQSNTCTKRTQVNWPIVW